MAALNQGQVLSEALRRASAAGALACTRLGAQSSIPTAAEIDAFLASQSAEPDIAELNALATYCGLASP